MWFMRAAPKAERPPSASRRPKTKNYRVGLATSRIASVLGTHSRSLKMRVRLGQNLLAISNQYNK
jgi:hypothetical protein